MDDQTAGQRHSRLAIMLALVAVYIFWGGTYLTIRFAVETIPSFTMAAIRFLTAGLLMYVWAKWRGAPDPEPRHWRAAGIVGMLLLLGGNGGVVWAARLLPSGVTALLVAMVPLWMVLINWLWQQEGRPRLGVIIGLLLGFIGIMILLGPEKLAGGGSLHPVGAIVVIIASLSWAVGSLYARKAALPGSPLLSIAMQMLAGGASLLLVGALSGEWAQMDWLHISMRSWVSLGYLITFGSLVGFSCYIWLLQTASPALVGTYAYVNPVVAVLLGWALADEPLHARTMIAAAAIVAAVILISISQTVPKKKEETGEPCTESPVERLKTV